MSGQNWRTASYSSENGGECIEVADGTRSIFVRDTKERNLGNARTVLSVTSEAWVTFTGSLR